MDNTIKGMGAGLIASVVMLVLLYAKQALGILSETDFVQLITDAFHRLGAPPAAATGWIALLAVGTLLWGGLFGAFNHFLPGETELGKGLWFSVFAWLVMLVALLSLENVDIFADMVDWSVAGVALVLHLIFGAILGATYASLIHVKVLQPIAH